MTHEIVILMNNHFKVRGGGIVALSVRYQAIFNLLLSLSLNLSAITWAKCQLQYIQSHVSGSLCFTFNTAATEADIINRISWAYLWSPLYIYRLVIMLVVS